jgi:transglutaminase-like putative cysteine protease
VRVISADNRLCHFEQHSPEMKTFHIDCELQYDVTQPTLFLFNLAAPSTDSQNVCAETTTTIPGLAVEQLQAAGSSNRLIRINAPPGPLNIRYLANVDVLRALPDPAAREIPVSELPADVLPYLVSSRYCESDILFPVACREFGHLRPGYARVHSICEWIRGNIEYKVGTSHALYTAGNALEARAGVCRDFAHIAIAFCRALNIPARFVTGYAKYTEPPPDFHAVFEAYLDGAWYLFDPTELSPVADLVRIGTGRDASEVAFATFFGAARLRCLSPLVERASEWHPAHSLVPLQQPGDGILLAA